MTAGVADQSTSQRGAVGFEVVHGKELMVIANRRNVPGLRPISDQAVCGNEGDLYRGEGTVGLALSGGGIRSATFALGVMQYLAHRGLLKHVDYLSTVSGGGYIGSSLTWFLYGNHGLFPKFEPTEIDTRFPYGAASPDRRITPTRPENPELAYLRGRGRYLTPGKGVTIVSGIGVVLRGMALNLLVWGPLVTGFFLLLFWANLSWSMGSANWLSVAAAASHYVWSMPWFSADEWSATLQRLGDVSYTVERLCDKVTFAWAFKYLGWVVGFFLFCCVVYSVGTYAGFDRPFPELGDNTRYFLRRLFEKGARIVLGLAALLLLIGTIPLAAGYLGGASSSGVLLSGVIGGVGTYLKSLLDGEEGRLPISRLAPIVALLFLYGFGMVCYLGAVAVFDNSEHIRQLYAHLVVLSLVSGIVININLTTLHRFYRDRLMEAFLPDSCKRCGGMSLAADSAFLCDMVDQETPRGPYHLVNTHFIVTNTEDAKLKLRGGDSFLLSPLYCGSGTTGWMDTRAYSKRLSLATAMAISGAAANPNAGVGGMGVTRNTTVALVMSLLNVRLGYWMPNPANPNFLVKNCNHFSPGLTSALTWGVGLQDSKRRWLQLSDGGHFDNTGMYELLRRRVRLILFCDGSSDPHCKFEDLFNVIERAHTDFGVVIKFDPRADLGFIAPHDYKDDYPLDLKLARRSYALARIIYPRTAASPPEEGLLVFMTTVVTHEASPSLIAHKDVNRVFPDESTMDQFFEEGQFEAYRELGWNVAWQTVNALGIESSSGAFLVPAYDENRERIGFPIE